MVEVRGRAKRSEERRGPRQITLGLCDPRLVTDGIDVVWCDIKNLIKIAQGFRETTKIDIGERALGEYR